MAESTTQTSPVPHKERAEQTQPERLRGGVYFTPRVDIVETDNELTLFADLPGVKPGDVDLRYEQGELALHGRCQPRHPERGALLNEYEVGDFYRAFQIHESIDASKIGAEFKNGVLTIHLPKMEKAKPRQITVRGA
jgi:HSP20 family molecular chaperone IbpA